MKYFSLLILLFFSACQTEHNLNQEFTKPFPIDYRGYYKMLSGQDNVPENMFKEFKIEENYLIVRKEGSGFLTLKIKALQETEKSIRISLNNAFLGEERPEGIYEIELPTTSIIDIEISYINETDFISTAIYEYQRYDDAPPIVSPM